MPIGDVIILACCPLRGMDSDRGDSTDSPGRENA